MGEANRREELIIYNFEEGREAEVVKGEKFLSGLYVTVRSGRQAFVLVRNEYSSEPPLYFVRGGSELYGVTPSRTEDRPKLVSGSHYIQIYRLCQIIYIGIFHHWLFLCGITFHLFFFYSFSIFIHRGKGVYGIGGLVSQGSVVNRDLGEDSCVCRLILSEDGEGKGVNAFSFFDGIHIQISGLLLFFLDYRESVAVAVSKECVSRKGPGYEEQKNCQYPFHWASPARGDFSVSSMSSAGLDSLAKGEEGTASVWFPARYLLFMW